jgi:hypothetical protein
MRSGRLATLSVTQDNMADLPGYCALTFTLMPVGSTSQRSVQESGFTEICLLTQLRRLYPLPVRQASALLTASSRFHLTMDTLAVQLTLPLAGCVEDFHLQVSAPCRAHKNKSGAQQAVTKRAIEVDEKRCSGWPDIAFCFGGGCFPSKIRLVKWRGRRWGYLASQRRGQLVTSEDIDHAFQVVGHSCQADLGLCSSKSAQQESRVSEDAIFEGCEGVFYDASS